MTSNVLTRLVPELFINGSWREAQDHSTFPVHDPASGRLLIRVAAGSQADGRAALDAAAAAQDDWARTPPRVRSEVLLRAFGIVTSRIEEFAELITLEMGKPLPEARAEVTYGAEFLRWFAEEAVRVSGRYSVSPDGRSRLLVHKRPVGPALLITPWNFPLAMATRKIAPALAAGCTVVLKPAALTPLTSLLLTQVLHEAGVPVGVVNVVPTANSALLVSDLIADPRLRKLSFTGSTEVGRQLLAQSAAQVLRVSMELGGNAPFLVFDDADLDAAVEGAVVAKLRNMGEACTAANRFLVHHDVAEEFAERLTDRLKSMVVGPGTALDSQIGPLINAAAQVRMQALVDEAVEKGAVIRTGGSPLDRPGYFYPPTVLMDVQPDAKLLTEEIFGPIAPIVRFTNEEQAVTLANATEYGLVAYVYTRDTARTLRMTELLECGIVGINVGVVSNPAAPFGGVKQSGLGREGATEGIDEYLETRYAGLGDPYA